MNPETKQKWIEWLSAYRPPALVAVFKEDELLLKTWGELVTIIIYGEIEYAHYRPDFKGVFSQASGRQAVMNVMWLKNAQSPIYNIDKVDIGLYPTRFDNSRIEDGTVLMNLYDSNVRLKLRSTDFTDIFVFTTDVITWIYPRIRIYPDEDDESTLYIDVYDEKLLDLSDDIINKIMNEPHKYFSPKLESKRIMPWERP